MTNGLELREATRGDAHAMLALLRAVCAEGDALPFIDGLDLALIDSQWFGAAGCVLAWRGEGLLGMYRFGPNMPGRGAHIATATFLVRREARGQGLGRTLVAHCLDAARDAGFRAMQLNQVLSSNTAALALYRSLGFRIAGTIPGAFEHLRLGYVDGFIMTRALTEEERKDPAASDCSSSAAADHAVHNAASRTAGTALRSGPSAPY